MTGALSQHVASGLTTLCRAWSITRRDGTVFGFTDHDCDLAFGGVTFRADTGLSALALQQSTGLAVDNTEALGALCDASLTEEDILAGRFDGAEVEAWLVNWTDIAARELLFRGTMGEMSRVDGAFSVEIRGLSEALNRPFGRVYQKPCSAVLGDKRCRVDLTAPGYTVAGVVTEVTAEAGLIVDIGGGFASAWFQSGVADLTSGAAIGLQGVIKRDDALPDGTRAIDLWEPLRAVIAPGDTLNLVAGCDKRFETCRAKFANGLNFQGFPDIPQDDWVMMAAPAAHRKTGGSRR